MPKRFLTAQWRNLLMANFETDAAVLHSYVRIHPVHEYSFHCDSAAIYGNHFADTLSQAPTSVFLAEGSGIEVMKGTILT